MLRVLSRSSHNLGKGDSVHLTMRAPPTVTWPQATWPEGSRAGMEPARAGLSHQVGTPEVTLRSSGSVTSGLSVLWNYPGTLRAPAAWRDGLPVKALAAKSDGLGSIRRTPTVGENRLKRAVFCCSTPSLKHTHTHKCEKKIKPLVMESHPDQLGQTGDSTPGSPGSSGVTVNDNVIPLRDQWLQRPTHRWLCTAALGV